MPDTFKKPEPISVEDLFNEYAAADQLQEGSRQPTVPTDTYDIQVKRYEGQKKQDGRKQVRIMAQLSKDNQRKGSVWFNASWQPRRVESTGKLDRESRLWSQLAMALYPNETEKDVADKPVATILEAAVKYPVRGFVMETFRTGTDDKGKATWDSPKADDTEKIASYRKAGFQAINSVTSIFKVS